MQALQRAYDGRIRDGESELDDRGRLHRLWADKRVRYVVVGVTLVGLNLALARLVFSFELFTRSATMRNVGNVLTTEVMVVVAFFLHRRFTWPTRQPGLLAPILQFHVVTGLGLVGRLIVFALLDAVGVGPMLATLASIPAAVIVNYIGYDRVVFKQKKES